MDHIQPYLDYFSAHPGWAIALVFLIAFGEALLIIGLFVPSTAVLVGAGILVGTGHLSFWPVLLATTAGAIAGDQVSYWAGRFYGERLKTLWPLNRYPQLVARGEDFVRQHGGKSIAIGRFVPGVKAVVPGIVGMFGMSQLFFVLVNFSSGIVWGAAHILPGILIGQGLAFAGEVSGRLLVVLIVLLVLLAISGYAIRLLAAGLSPVLNHGLLRVSQWAGRYRSRSMQRFARTVAPDNPRSLLVVLFAAIVLAGLLGFLNIFVRLVSRDVVSNLDVSIFNLMREMRNAPADEILIVVTMLGDGIVLTILAIAIIGWLAWHKSYRAAIAATITVLAGKIFVPILKYGIQRPRPVSLYDGAEAFSFPSGHATMSALIFGVLAVLVSHAMGRWGRAVVYASCGLAVVAIAYSRVYLGAHWLSDVLGGLLFGGAMAGVYAMVIEAIPPRRIRPLGLFGFSLVVFMLAGIFHVSTNYRSAEASYTPPSETISLSDQDWLDSAWQRLPARRIDFGGSRSVESFAAQYAGSLDAIASGLKAAGWTERPAWTWRDGIGYLNPAATLADLLPRPSLHIGLRARLTLIRAVDADRRLVLRFYKTDYGVSGAAGNHAIFAVSMTEERLRRGFDLYAIPSDTPATAEDLALLHADLSSAAGLRIAASPESAGGPIELIIEKP